MALRRALLVSIDDLLALAIGLEPMASGKEFTDRLFGLRKRAATGQHEFDQLCGELGIEHRLAPPQEL